jgi:glycosyltransferase involved in cell wall biosynthesis
MSNDYRYISQPTLILNVFNTAWQTIVAHWRRVYFGLGVLKEDGPFEFWRRFKARSPHVLDQIGQSNQDYSRLLQRRKEEAQQIKRQISEGKAFAYQPMISLLVPVYNVKARWLLEMIGSVRDQSYPNWQLCLVDDASSEVHIAKTLLEYAEKDSRIKVKINAVNQGIALTSMDAYRLAEGDFIGLLDHDDMISSDALYHYVAALNRTADIDFLYSDEDKIQLGGSHVQPFFKPDYSPELLESQNYICHFSVIRKTLMDEVGAFRPGYDGSQDHDLILRATAKARRIEHVAKVLYHWRKVPGSTAAVYDAKSYAWEAGRLAVADHVRKNDPQATVELGESKGTYRVVHSIKGEPLVSIVIPFRDKPELLQGCIDTIISLSSDQNIEIVGINNGSESAETRAVMAQYQAADARIRFVDLDIPFNYSKLCNFGVTHARGEYLILLNNDIEITEPHWIENLLMHAQGDGVGAVGGKLYYPDGRIQHAGIVTGMVGAAGHPHKFFHKKAPGYYARLQVVSNVSAVTGAMLMVAKAKYQEVGGLDEENLAIAYNDIDFCLKLLSQGYRNIFTPYCQAIHQESASRGYEDSPEKIARLQRESAYFTDRWAEFLAKGDPYYNENLSLQSENFSLRD